jgi:hypothetical protein
VAVESALPQALTATLDLFMQVVSMVVELVPVPEVLVVVEEQTFV